MLLDMSKTIFALDRSKMALDVSKDSLDRSNHLF
jgi:hypothetical protein